GPRMADACRWEPTLHVTHEPLPRHSVSLTPPTKRPSPEHCDVMPERGHARKVSGHSIVAEVTCEHRPQVLPLFRDGIVHAPPQLESQLAQLRVPPCAHGLPQQHATTLTIARRDVREAEEVEGAGLVPPTGAPVSMDHRSKRDQARFVGVELESELR